MLLSFFVSRLHRVLGALSPGGGHKRRRSWARRFTETRKPVTKTGT
jgi:hypothetical protein